jgi:hypothetical protein
MKARMRMVTNAAAPNALPTMTPVFIDLDDAEPLVGEAFDIEDEANDVPDEDGDDDSAEAVVLLLAEDEGPGVTTWR